MNVIAFAQNNFGTIPQVSKDSLRQHTVFLGDDALQGRGTGTDGEILAANYIAGKLRQYGLLPKGDRRTYFQNIPMHGSVPTKRSELFGHLGDVGIEFNLGEDYLLFQGGSQTYVPKPLPLIFVGYGIVAPEYDYNDYQNVDVAGKIVVFISGEPFSNDPDYFGGANPTIYAYPEAKQRIAISRGAAGSILIPSSLDQDAKPWEAWQTTFSFEDVRLAYAVSSVFNIVMNPDAAPSLFDHSDVPFWKVMEMDQTNTIRSFPMNSDLLFKGDFRERDFLSHNVVGLIPATASRDRDSYIILSAHYDHLGVGKPVAGDSVYNGVFDNATGVAALLELARIFSELEGAITSSLLFLFTTGEEKGLLGATYYTDHPIVPLYKTKANINVDGIAMFDTFDDFVGVGSKYSSLSQTLENVAQKLGMSVSKIPDEFLSFESFSRSDQIAFAKAGIPAILIAEGTHYRNISASQGRRMFIRWMQTRYHTPLDDLSQPMNWDAARQHCEIIAEVCQQIANESTVPQWMAGIPFVNVRLQTIAEKR